MIDFVMSYITKQKVKTKTGTLQRAQYRLEIIFNCLNVHNAVH